MDLALPASIIIPTTLSSVCVNVLRAVNPPESENCIFTKTYVVGAAYKGTSNITKLTNFRSTNRVHIKANMQLSPSCGFFGSRTFTHAQMGVIELI